MTASGAWTQFNEMLTHKITAWSVSAYAALAGAKGMTLEFANHATSLLGLLSLVIAIVVGYLTIKNLRLKNRLLQKHLDESSTTQLKEAVLKDLQR